MLSFLYLKYTIEIEQFKKVKNSKMLFYLKKPKFQYLS